MFCSRKSCTNNSFIGVLCSGFLLAALYLTRDKNRVFVVNENSVCTPNSSSDQNSVSTPNNSSNQNSVTTPNISFPKCNLFLGKWVFDAKSYPLYKEQECSFMMGDYSCEKYGRNETKYQQWRWQPHDCDLPRFNATKLLEILRNKRLIFVGDSLNKNQWDSLVCLVESSIPSSAKSSEFKGSLTTFKAIEYNASIEFYWAPLLVESNCDDAVEHHVMERIVRIQAIEKHARHWTNADILVFDSFMWWLAPNMTLLWGSFNSSDGIYKEVRRIREYEMALKTWSDWLDIHIDRCKTKLFFTSLSPYHRLYDHGRRLGKAYRETCYSEAEPINKEGYRGTGTDVEMMRVVEAAIHELETRGVKVNYLNITQLSDYRKDGHPSIYRKMWQTPTEEQLLSPNSYSDCVHWCLPGVPDVWNEILYAYILHHT